MYNIRKIGFDQPNSFNNGNVLKRISRQSTSLQAYDWFHLLLQIAAGNGENIEIGSFKTALPEWLHLSPSGFWIFRIVGAQNYINKLELSRANHRVRLSWVEVELSWGWACLLEVVLTKSWVKLKGVLSHLLVLEVNEIKSPFTSGLEGWLGDCLGWWVKEFVWE